MELKYKEGDKVTVKNIEWYKKTKNKFDVILCGALEFTPLQAKQFCGKDVTIDLVMDDGGYYCIKEDGYKFYWNDYMFEDVNKRNNSNSITQNRVDELNKENKSNEQLHKTLIGLFPVKDGHELIPREGYEIKKEGDKFYLVRKKPEYPRNYAQCCEYMKIDYTNYITIKNIDENDGEENLTEYEKGLIDDYFDILFELRVCRDAYWKMAGHEMGLNKPWEPDFNDPEQIKYAIVNYQYNASKCRWDYSFCTDFVFPTEEIRDIFYETFNKQLDRLYKNKKYWV